MSSTQHSILYILSQYEILELTAKNLSTLDLYYLGLSCRELYGRILNSKAVFNQLKRLCLCDGHGLKERQNFSGVFSLPYYIYQRFASQTAEPYSSHSAPRSRPSWAPPSPNPSAPFDQEIEVRVWNITCDAANALPCLRCQVNVCEECRWVPRVRRMPGNQSHSEPHIDTAGCISNIICYCDLCDEGVEFGLPLRQSRFCDCNQYKRWICLPCSHKESLIWTKYVEQGGAQERWDYEQACSQQRHEEGLWINHVPEGMTFWCPCGKRVPPTGKPRCGWCKRRLRPDWQNEELSRMQESNFDKDPCETPEAESYRVAAPSGGYGIEYRYPRLEYTGPIAP